MKFSIKIRPGLSINIQGGSNSITYEDCLLRDTKADVLNRLKVKGQYFTGEDRFDLGNDTDLTWTTAFEKISEQF